MDDEPDEGRPLCILTESPTQGIWTHLSVWQSHNVAERHIRDRARQLNAHPNESLIETKATALAYCIRTAREYLHETEGQPTSGVVARYYGCLWLPSAILVSDPTNDVTLERLERFTTFGHGLASVINQDAAFPDNEFIFLKPSGFFRHFLAGTGLTKEQINSMVIPQRVDDFSSVDESNKPKLITLVELFARIPELKHIFEYVTEKPALCFRIGHFSLNQSENFDDATKSAKPGYPPPFPQRIRPYTWLWLPDSLAYDEAHIVSFGPPLQEMQIREHVLAKGWSGKLPHPVGARWYDHIDTYRTTISGNTWVRPIMAIKSVFPMHLMLLYILSILARYRPAIWREILEGKQDQYSALIDAYLAIFDRVGPELALRLILGRPVAIITPGSLFAPA